MKKISLNDHVAEITAAACNCALKPSIPYAHTFMEISLKPKFNFWKLDFGFGNDSVTLLE